MKLLLENLHRHHWSRATIRSLDGCVYRLEMEEGGNSRLVWRDASTVLTTRNLTHMRELLAGIDIDAIVLLHDSAYDEMVGQPPSHDNRLQIPLTRIEPPTSLH